MVGYRWLVSWGMALVVDQWMLILGHWCPVIGVLCWVTGDMSGHWGPRMVGGGPRCDFTHLTAIMFQHVCLCGIQMTVCMAATARAQV